MSRIQFIRCRFILVTLFTMMTIVAFALAVHVYSLWREHAALDRIRREWPEALWEDYTEEPGPPGEPSILKGTRVRWIGLVTVDDAPPAVEFKWFSDFKKLKSLHFSSIKLTTEHFEYLPALPTVEELRLTFCPQVTDTEIKLTVQRMPNLRSLNLRGTSITDKCIAYIARLEHLTSLSLADTEITGTTLHQLRRCSLEELTLDESDVDTDALAQIVQLSGLRKLSILDTPIDRDSLHHLAGLQSLRLLILMDVDGMDQGELEELQSALPQCTILP